MNPTNPKSLRSDRRATREMEPGASAKRSAPATRRMLQKAPKGRQSASHGCEPVVSGPNEDRSPRKGATRAFVSVLNRQGESPCQEVKV
jgi:hypothetical protein